jgi:hypothetical protein
MYKEFVLRNPDVWTAFCAVIKGNAKAFADKGTPFRIILTNDSAKRNELQNRRYWGYLLKHISEQSFVNGQQFDKDVWHEYLARKFGVLEEVTLPDGEIITRRKSTTQMSVSEFGEYMENVQSYAAMNLGVVFEQ